MIAPTLSFSCVEAAYALRHACIQRNWRSVKAEVAWATANSAQVTAALVSGEVRIEVRRGNTKAVDVIICPDPREASQIIESLRECGATIVEGANEPH